MCVMQKLGNRIQSPGSKFLLREPNGHHGHPIIFVSLQYESDIWVLVSLEMIWSNLSLIVTVSLHFCKMIPNAYITNFYSLRRSFYLERYLSIFGEPKGMVIFIHKGRTCILSLPVPICSRSDLLLRGKISNTSVKKYLETLFWFDSGKCLSIHHGAAVTIDSACTCLGPQLSRFPQLIKLPSFMWFHIK